MLLKFNQFEKKNDEMNLESLIFPNYIERLNNLKDMIDRYDGKNMKDTEYIGLLDRYLYNFSKLSRAEDKQRMKELFEYVYEKSDLMRAENFEEQESLNNVIKKINKLCDEYGCKKIKNANGEII